MFCDRLTVLRNGKDTGTFALSEVTDDQVIELIIGRSLSATFPPKPPFRSGGRSVVSTRGIATAKRLSDITLDLILARFWALRACRAWASRSFFWPFSGRPPSPAAASRLMASP